LTKLGLELIKNSPGLCKDGHDRADVRAHNHGTCLPTWKRHDARIRHVRVKAGCTGKAACACKGKGCVELAPREDQSGREVVPVFHDESIIQSNMGRKTHWGEVGGRFCHKTSGLSIMVSGLICACHGRIEIKPDEVAEFERFLAAQHPGVEYDTTDAWSSKHTHDGASGHHSFASIKPGKNGDGWWLGTDVVTQVGQFLPIFEWKHPGAQAMIVFDNSTNHGVFPEGALVVCKGVNVKPGGINAPGVAARGDKHPAVPPMRNGWHMVQGVQVDQQMHDPNADGTCPGTFKGTKKILTERGLFQKGLRGDCQAKVGEEKAGGVCCCKHLLMNQPDFLAQKTALEELCEAAGHTVLMLPKCHPELNPIEQFWAAMKDCLRRVCGHTGPDLIKNVPESIRRVPLAQIQRYFRRAERFVALCRFEHENGLMLTGAVRDHATKIHKRHRTVPDNLLQNLRLDMEQRQTKLEGRLETGRGKAAVVQAKLARVKAVLRAVYGAGGN